MCDLVAVLILFSASVLLASRRVPPLAILGLGGLIGILAYH
jgi:hypothetical protein